MEFVFVSVPLACESRRFSGVCFTDREKSRSQTLFTRQVKQKPGKVSALDRRLVSAYSLGFFSLLSISGQFSEAKLA